MDKKRRDNRKLDAAGQEMCIRDRFEDVYLEIGLLLGARIAFQICGKIAELSDG